MREIIAFILLIIVLNIFKSCRSHPRDQTNLDDIIHCGFGKEYVSGYTTSKGRKVHGYCRNQN